MITNLKKFHLYIIYYIYLFINSKINILTIYIYIITIYMNSYIIIVEINEVLKVKFNTGKYNMNC
jgi:hypothetical protein